MNAVVAVDVQVASDVASIPDAAVIECWMQDSLASALEDDGLEVSVRVVGESEIRELNGRFRAQDKATNVLSFPADQEGLPPGGQRSLGDIVICAPVVEREASQQGKKVSSHWAHMLVHGALHLLGYDHESDEDAGTMEALEIKILAARGIADPYAADHDV